MRVHRGHSERDGLFILGDNMKNSMNLRIRKNKVSKTNSKLQHKSREINMPLELIDHIFDRKKVLAYESPEEKQIREQKEDYNALILKQISELPFTERQKQVFQLMYKEGKTMTATAKELGLGITTIQKIKEAIFKKIKKRIIYDFKADVVEQKAYIKLFSEE